MRTVVDLPPEQISGLAAFCAEKNVSRAEAVRRAVQLLLEQKEADEREDREALDASFGIWRDRKFDARKYIDEMRDESERQERLWSRAESSTATSRLREPASEDGGPERFGPDDPAFGLWKDRKFDARDWINDLRSEWSEREERLWKSKDSSTPTS